MCSSQKVGCGYVDGGEQSPVGRDTTSGTAQTNHTSQTVRSASPTRITAYNLIREMIQQVSL